MSADLRGTSSDTPAAGDQPRPAGQPQPADRPPAPPVADQAAGEEARRQKYAHLTEGSGQAPARPDPPAPATEQPRGTDHRPVPPATDQAAGAEARRQKYAHLTEAPRQAPSRPDPPARPAGETGQAPSPEARQPHSPQKETRPPEAHALTDRRYPTLEDYQKARNAAPPAAHTDHPQGTDKPPAAGKPPAADAAQDPGHPSGADRTGTHPYPEVPQQPPADPGRPVDPGRQASGGAITHLHFEGPDTSTDIYTAGSRTAVVYSPADKPHLGLLSSEGSEPANGDPAALPHDVARYLSTGDRQVGIPVVGEKPDKSPGDTSDLPPSGKELVEGAEKDKLSRFERARRTVESQEILGDAPDAITEQGNAWQHALAKMPPEGHSVQAVHDHPQPASTNADHATVGDIASTGVMLGIVLFEGGRWLAGHLGHRKEG